MSTEIHFNPESLWIWPFGSDPDPAITFRPGPARPTCTYEVYDSVGSPITEVDGCLSPEEFVAYWRRRSPENADLNATIINGGDFVEFTRGLPGLDTFEAQAKRVVR